MSSVFAMITKADGPVFQKGDIVSVNGDAAYFGENIKNNPKFHLLEITGVTMGEAVALIQPMMNSMDGEDSIVYARNVTVDIDLMINTLQVTREFFLENISTKIQPDAVQSGEVVV